MAKKRSVLFLALICTVVGIGFYLLKNSIPDQVNLLAGQEGQLELNYPMNELVQEEVVAADSQGKSNIPDGQVKVTCKLLGVIPIKDIQVNTVEKKSVIPGGLPIGIYMKTEGILVVGTGTV